MLWLLKLHYITENGLKKKPSKNKINLKDLKKIKIEEALMKILSSPNHSNKNGLQINMTRV